MQIVAFIDLDDTLFQTLPKCPEREGLRATAFAPTVGESFMTPRQHALFELLRQAATVVPVTARNIDAFQRVDLAFSSFAVLDFGGVILLPDRTPDPQWLSRIRPLATDAERSLVAMLERCDRFIEQRQLGVRARLIRDLDLSLYIVMKHPSGNTAALDTIGREFLANENLSEYFVHRNNNNLSVVPRFLGKEHAVRYLLEHHFAGQCLTLGVGDSRTDLGFLRLCDYAVCPRDSQLGGLLGSLAEKS